MKITTSSMFTVLLIAFIFALGSLPALAQDEIGERVYVLGAVNSPGDFPYSPGMGVKEALEAAGGLAPNADFGGVILIRADNEKVTLNIKAILDGSEVVPISPGDTIVAKPSAIRVAGEVQKPGVYDFKPGMSAADALALAGGPTDIGAIAAAFVTRGDQTMPANLASPNPPAELEPNDVLTVPEMSVSITGEVANPGTYPLVRGKTDNLEVLLQEAGGSTAKADLKKVRISSIRGEESPSRTVDASSDAKRQAIIVESGDIVFIPQVEVKRKHRITLNEIYQITLIIYTLTQIFGD